MATSWKEVAEALWQILDDVSTAGDMAKSDDAGYRKLVEKIIERRCDYMQSPDGYRLEPVLRDEKGLMDIIIKVLKDADSGSDAFVFERRCAADSIMDAMKSRLFSES